MARRITEAYREGWLTPPAMADLAATSPAPPAQRLPALEAARAPAAPAASSLTPFEQVHEYLVAGGQLVRVAEGMFFHRDALAAAAGMVQRQLLEHGRLSVSDFRQQAGTTRKYAVPLLEYFDSVRLTRRQGEERVAGSALQAGAAGTVPAVGPQPPTKEMSARE